MTRHTARKVGGTGRPRQSAAERHGAARRPGAAATGRAGRARARGRGPVARPVLLAGLLAALLAGVGACGGDDAPDDSEPVPAAGFGAPEAGPVALGVDVLFRDSLHLLEGRSVGLITNHTGLSWPARGVGDPAAADSGATTDDAPAATVETRTEALTRENGVLTIDRLHRHPGVDLVALYSPEHGIRGIVEAGQAVEGGVDSATGLPIHSLYGDTRKPTPAMLDGIDVLVFDIQDIGARYYTYVWTMALAMEAAGEAGIDFVVLDRPNPIGGDRVQGNVLDPEFATFVGLYPVPMRHGLTAGELARLLVGEHGVDVDLTVVPMDGWTRGTWWVQTGLPFVPPSPNMPSVASATHYPGTCLFEGTNLSVGRGTDRAFQWIGAPWLDADLLADRLNRMVRDARAAPDTTTGPLAGLYFKATRFIPTDPGDGKFPGEEVRALELVMTDPGRYDPTLAAVAALVEIHREHADALRWNVSHFDRLAGTDALREGVVAGRLLETLVARWPAQIESFEETRAPYLLYR